jgi:prepilin-type N-terminal cleavage/methylation domain-containing protein
MTSPRRGLTLIEILIVVAVMVLIASLASPALIGMLETQKLRKSSDVLRSEFARTRLRAMKTGRIQMFRYQYNASGYIAQPWYAGNDELESNQTSQEMNGVLRASQQDVQFDDTPMELPEGVIFIGGQTLSDARSAAIDQAILEAEAGQAIWAPPILFYPDGTCSEALVMLKNNKHQVVEVSLRGITGMSQASDVTKQESLTP